MFSRYLFNLKTHLLLAGLMRDNDFMSGKELEKFETSFASYLGSQCVVGVGSGTDALIYALKSLGIGNGDEVIVPAISCPSTAFAIIRACARPVFVDIDSATFTLDHQQIEQAITERTKAIIPVHIYNYIAKMDKIALIAKRHNLFIIEDAAQAIGTRYKGSQIGTFSDIACISFSPMKIFSTFGSGGAIATNNQGLSRKFLMLKKNSKQQYGDYSNQQIIGATSRLDNFHAGILNLKLPFLGNLIMKQQSNFYLYGRLLKGVGDLVLPYEDSGNIHNGYCYAIRTKKKESLSAFLKNATRDKRHFLFKGFPVLPTMKAFSSFKNTKSEFPVAEAAAKEILVLPTHYTMRPQHISLIIDLIKKYFK